MIERDITGYIQDFSEYTELRIQENTHLSIGFLNGNLISNSRSVTSGISARVYRNGVWGYSSHPEITRETAVSVVKVAGDNARFLDLRDKKGKPPLPRVSGTMEKAFFTKKKRLNQNEYIDFARAIDEYIEKNLEYIVSRTVSLRTLDMEKSLVTSDGSHAYSMIPRSHIIVKLSTDMNGETVDLYKVIGGLGQFEDVFEKPGDLFSVIAELHSHLMKKREGIFAQAGLHDCILDSRLAGILAHEALGHTTEADIILGGSVAPDYLNKEAASPLISITDFAHTALGETCPVPVYIDDEGTPAEDVVIIEKGILKGYMHNKATALHFQARPTGNARALSFSDEPIIRMRNTAILPGNDNLDNMIKSIDHGYYLVDSSNGQADSTGEFTFGVPLGYEIKNGTLGKAIMDTTISGIAFQMLKTVTMVSSDMSWETGGMCGKKQWIPVAMGGPAIKCKVMIGGK
jgi:TldD protein